MLFLIGLTDDYERPLRKTAGKAGLKLLIETVGSVEAERKKHVLPKVFLPMGGGEDFLLVSRQNIGLMLIGEVSIFCLRFFNQKETLLKGLKAEVLLTFLKKRQRIPWKETVGNLADSKKA